MIRASMGYDLIGRKRFELRRGVMMYDRVRGGNAWFVMVSWGGEGLGEVSIWSASVSCAPGSLRYDRI